MTTYHIVTDDHTMTIDAPDLAEALRRFGAPASVSTADEFAAWLESVDGYGHIDADDTRLVEVVA